MQMNYSNSKKVSSFILCMVLMVAMSLSTVGCNGSKNSGAASGAEGTQAGVDVQREGGELGEGSKEFALTVTDKDGNETQFTIHTDKGPGEAGGLRGFLKRTAFGNGYRNGFRICRRKV